MPLLIIKFGVAGRHPKDAGRTPQWDEEEDKIFNTTEDDKYLKSKNINYSREGNYYVDNKGKYLPGIIYYSPDGKTWSHYGLGPNGIDGFNPTDLSQEQYDLYRTLGLNNERFYRNAEDAEFYRPNPELKLPENGKPIKIGNSTVTFRERYPHRGKAVSKNSLRGYLNYGSWDIVDPDKGYDFTVSSDLLRDGGSRVINLRGKYPDEWNQYSGGMVRYNGFFPDEDEEKQAEINRNGLNNILKAYGIQFEKNGGIMKKYQQGGQLSNTQQQGLQYLAQMYAQQTGKDPQQDQEGFMQFVQQLAQQAGVQDIGQLLDMIYQQAAGQAQAAKRGAKLNYLKTLSNKCPEGQELVYLRIGGKVCSKCMAKKVKTEKCGSKMKKKKACGGTKMKFQLGGIFNNAPQSGVTGKKKVPIGEDGLIALFKEAKNKIKQEKRNSGKGGKSSKYGGGMSQPFHFNDTGDGYIMLDDGVHFGNPYGFVGKNSIGYENNTNIVDSLGQYYNYENNPIPSMNPILFGIPEYKRRKKLYEDYKNGKFGKAIEERTWGAPYSSGVR